MCGEDNHGAPPRRRRLPAHEETEQTGEMSYGRIWAGHGFLGLLGSDPREAQVEKKG